MNLRFDLSLPIHTMVYILYSSFGLLPQDFPLLNNIIGHYNPSVRNIGLSHTTYVVFVNLIHKWRDLKFKADSERQIFWETLPSNFIYSQSFCQKSAETNRRRNTFCILFWCLAWGSYPGFTSNKPTHYLLDYGDYPLLNSGPFFEILASRQFAVQYYCQIFSLHLPWENLTL